MLDLQCGQFTVYVRFCNASSALLKTAERKESESKVALNFIDAPPSFFGNHITQGGAGTSRRDMKRREEVAIMLSAL